MQLDFHRGLAASVLELSVAVGISCSTSVKMGSIPLNLRHFRVANNLSLQSEGVERHPKLDF
jgi:hypothetical protein